MYIYKDPPCVHNTYKGDIKYIYIWYTYVLYIYILSTLYICIVLNIPLYICNTCGMVHMYIYKDPPCGMVQGGY